MPRIISAYKSARKHARRAWAWAMRRNFLERGEGLQGNAVVVGEGLKCIGKNSLRFSKPNGRNRIEIGKNVNLHALKLVINGTDHRLMIADNVRLTGHILITGKGRTIRIGANTTMQGVYMLSRDADITVGERCMFSREIEIRATDVHKVYDRATNTRVNPAKPVVVGNDVWVGARAFISKGGMVPDGSVVGAMALVNKPFTEPNIAIAGVPAKVIRRNIRWER